MNNTIKIVALQPGMEVDFKALNIAWLQKYFYVEPVDEEMLSHPVENIIDKGGKIFFALHNGEVAGTFALMKQGDGNYELGKMAVDEKFQGKNIGNLLLEYAIDESKKLGAQKIILYSNTILKPAIHLYQKFGFVEVPIEQSAYKRSNIKMEKQLGEKGEGRVDPRLKTLFSGKQKNVLNVYCTAGFPELESTLPVMRALQNAGAHIIELGMPYSDPLADGPVIQASSARALQNGMSIAVLFEQLKNFRSTIHLPVVLMGYLNPLLQYGFEKFCQMAAETGVDALIIPDMPMHAFEVEYGKVIKRHGLDFIFLVTPETSEERIRKLDELSSGFLYAVSSSSLTGSDKDFSAVEDYLERLMGTKLRNPVLVGFGIKDKKTFDTACRFANGAIIGSAYIQALQANENVEEATRNFIEGVKQD